ncbi:Anthranilate phosphoribosyltransferase, chloroplastic [Galdieria sulphuraria]|nr:Anthranilate phosphoribosyltransferase, chloroplastic [Galdieria sulphuraria]
MFVSLEEYVGILAANRRIQIFERKALDNTLFSKRESSFPVDIQKLLVSGHVSLWQVLTFALVAVVIWRLLSTMQSFRQMLTDPSATGPNRFFDTLRTSMYGFFSDNLKKEEKMETDLKPILEKLVMRRNLSLEESRESVAKFLGQSDANPYQVAAFLSLLRSKGETAEELAGMALAMRQQSLSVPLPSSIPYLVDIVGTGGDGADTVNISTGAAILAAACGAKVAKHGSHSSSSKCGSADVLESLGVKVSLSPKAIARCLEEVGIAFLYAPRYHPSMKLVANIRKGLRIRTAFNLLGPLTNPALVSRQVIGVSHEELMEKLAIALQLLGTERSWVLHCSGLDELSPLGSATVLEVTPDDIHRYAINPAQYGFPTCQLEDLKGADANFNAHILRECLRGKPSAISNSIILNAGAALVVSGMSESFGEAITLAARTLMSGSSLELLERWIRLTQTLE